MKIVNVNQLKQVTLIDSEVVNRASNMLEILDAEYGSERSLTDAGGYVLMVQDNDQADIDELDEFVGLYDNCIVEYAETFVGDDERTYCEMLLLLSSDYGVVIYMTQALFEKYESQFRWY